jgi:hypothetical protein
MITNLLFYNLFYFINFFLIILCGKIYLIIIFILDDLYNITCLNLLNKINYFMILFYDFIFILFNALIIIKLDYLLDERVT